MLNRHLTVAALLAATVTAGPGAADPPQSRDRVFRDWRLECAAPPCTVATRVTGADGRPVLELRVADATLRIVTELPLFLPDGLGLAVGEAPEWQVAWRSCAADRCEARITLEPDLLRALRRERSGSVQMTLLDGTRVRLPVSLLGFTAAYAALPTSR